MKTSALFFFLALFPLAAQAQGTIKATTRMRPDGSNLTTVTNPDTRTKEETITDAGGKVLSKTIYFLNEQNFAKGATHLDGKGVVRYKETYTLDYTGRSTEWKFYSADNRPLGRRVFFYDGAQTSLKRVEDYDANGNLLSPGARRSAPEVRRATPVR